ncbi:flotillin-like protein 3 [Silene latifolia]|uniref:flotillin-like protein 3 n=1 Tax=Silene latifolia TaxID=37657 RepID=UPI003D76DD56
MSALPQKHVVAGPYEYLAITGWKIPGIKFAKKAVILPGQRYTSYIVCPVNYRLEVHAMTADKHPFLIPVVFSVGLNVNDEDSLVRYTNLVNSYRMNCFVEGIIKMEIRELAGWMTMEEIVFKGSKDFEKKVFDKVELALNKFGLIIYNADFKQLVDVSGQGYFSTKMAAANQAKMDVPEATIKGETETTKIMRDNNLSMLMESSLDFVD